jgi:hypothetical protein
MKTQPDDATATESKNPRTNSSPQSGSDTAPAEIKPLILLRITDALWRVRLTPGWIWHRVTEDAQRHAKIKSEAGKPNAGKVGAHWRLAHYLHKSVKEAPTGPGPAPEPESVVTRNIELKPDEEIETVGKLVAGSLVMVSLPFWCLYATLGLPIYYSYRVTAFLLDLLEYDNNLNEYSRDDDNPDHATNVVGRAKQTLITSAIGTVLIAVALVASSGSLASALYGTLFLSTVLLVGTFSWRQKDLINWTSRKVEAGKTRKRMPGYTGKFRDQDVVVPKNETFAGESNSDDPQATAPPLILGEFIPSPLETEVEEVQQGVIAARKHQQFLPDNEEMYAIHPQDLPKHIVVQGSIGTGKTTKIIMPIITYLVDVLKPLGVGGLIFDFKGRYNPITKRSGSLDLEHNCDKVFALDRGEKSARFNPLRAGGQALLESIFGAVDSRSNSSYYHEFEIKFGAMLVDVLLACEKAASKYETIMVRNRGDKIPALLMPGNFTLRYHAALRHASIDALDNLVAGTKRGSEIAVAINRMLRAHEGNSPVDLSNRRDPRLIVELSDADWDSWEDYFNKVVGTYHLIHNDTENKEEWEIKPPPGQMRATFLKSMSGLATKINLLRKTYGILLDDSDPDANVINLEDCIDGNTIFGFRLSGGGGEAQRMIGKCILRLWTDLVVDKGYERNTLNTLLILDECVTLLGNDEEFGRGFLDKGRSMGAGAVLAYQFVKQWIGNEVTLGNLLENCGTLLRLTPINPAEAVRLNLEELPKDKVETIETTGNRSLIDVDQQLFGLTGVGEGRHEHDWEHYPPQYLASSQHEALFTGYYNGRRYANRLLCVEKTRVQERAEEELRKGRFVYLAKPGVDDDRVEADSSVDDELLTDDAFIDVSWADVDDGAYEEELATVAAAANEPTAGDWAAPDSFDAWAAQGNPDLGGKQ